MLLRLEVSDSVPGWWFCSLLVRSGELVLLTGLLPRPVLLLTLHRPVLPVPTLPRPLSDLCVPRLPAPPPTMERLPWLPAPPPSSSPPPPSPLLLDLDFGMTLLLLCLARSGWGAATAWLRVRPASAFFTLRKMPPELSLLLLLCSAALPGPALPRNSAVFPVSSSTRLDRREARVRCSSLLNFSAR